MLDNLVLLFSKVFREIRYTDELGSGMRNTNKETNKEISDKIIDILETKSDISVNEIVEILEISVGGVSIILIK